MRGSGRRKYGVSWRLTPQKLERIRAAIATFGGISFRDFLGGTGEGEKLKKGAAGRPVGRLKKLNTPNISADFPHVRWGGGGSNSGRYHLRW